MAKDEKLEKDVEIEVEKVDEVDPVPTPTPQTFQENVIAPNGAVKAVDLPRKTIGSNSDVAVSSFAGGSIQQHDLGGTPHGGYDRGIDRSGRIRNYDVQLINSVVSERAVPEFYEEKDLTDGGHQGTRGRKNANVLTLMRKNSDSDIPIDDGYHKSLDLILKDRIISTQGLAWHDAAIREVYPEGTETSPGIVDESVQTRGTYYGESDRRPIERSNYLYRSVQITKDDDGISMSINVEEVPVKYGYNNALYVGDNIIDSSCLMGPISINEIAVAHEDMKEKAGDEKLATWSPLANAVYQPIKQLALFRDLEASAGSIMAASAKSIKQSLAFQLNLLAKDGNVSINPMNRHLTGIWGATPPSATSNTLRNFIALNDSLSKYNTKADYLSQRRSFNLYANKITSNLDGFMIRPEFKKYLDFATAYGFEGESYDPSRPVFGTQKLYMIDSVDASKLATYSKDSVSHTLSYAYSEERNNYRRSQSHDVFDGIFNWLVRNQSRFCDKFWNDAGTSKLSAGTNDTPQTITIPIYYDMAFGSKWAYLVAAASSEIQLSRVDSKEDILAYEENFVYPFSELKPLKDFPIMDSKYVGFSDIYRSLDLKTLAPELKVDFLAPELLSFVGESEIENVDTFMLPWYMRLDSFSKSGNVWENDLSMNWPKIRKGNIMDIMKTLVDMGSEKFRKTFDIMTMFPGYYYQNGGIAGDSIEAHTLGNDSNNIALTLNFGLSDLTLDHLIGVPRALGFLMPCPSGIAGWVAETDIAGGDTLSDIAVDVSSVHRAIVWQADGNAHERGQAYHQSHYFISTESDPAAFQAFQDNYGVVISPNFLFNSESIVTAEATTGADYLDLSPLFYSMFTKALWFINPFDQAFDRTAGEDDTDRFFHPLAVPTWFGLVGFQKSEYATEFDQYVDDKVVNDYTQVSLGTLVKQNLVLE